MGPAECCRALVTTPTTCLKTAATWRPQPMQKFIGRLKSEIASIRTSLAQRRPQGSADAHRELGQPGTLVVHGARLAAAVFCDAP
ncbi:MAG: hypothetical protein ACF8CQ_17895 [Rhodopirellula sp. JB044]|uniref:hypothetical protein n=1 Tax=Rhodopirellula sp. JB044 TaxID=3342844 RepID=UPI00370A9A54